MQAFSDRFQGVWSPPYLKKLAFQVAMGLLIIGGLNWFSVGLLDVNLVECVMGSGMLACVVYALVGISAVEVMFDRDSYLPFLGPMVAPCSVLQDRVPPGATKDVKVAVVPNAKVMYWAAEAKHSKAEHSKAKHSKAEHSDLKEVKSWKEAYDNYDNAGVTTSNSDGIAILKVREPQSYKVPFRGKLDAHVHYRVCGESGFMERVQTVNVNATAPEGFTSEIQDKYAKRRNLAESSASIY